MAVTLTVRGATPPDTALDVTVYASKTGGDTPDDSETVTITGLGSADDLATTTLTLTALTTEGETYWTRAEPRTEDPFATPIVDWIDVSVDPGVDPIGYHTWHLDGEAVELPVYPIGSPRPDLMHATTADGQLGSLNPVRYDNPYGHSSPVRLRHGGENWMLATEDLLTGPEREPEPSPETVIDDFERWAFRFYNDGAACSPFLISDTLEDDEHVSTPYGPRSLYMGHAEGSPRIFSAPGDGLNYYPRPGDTITWHIHTHSWSNFSLYFGGSWIGDCYGVTVDDDSAWLHARYGGGNYDEFEYESFHTGMLHDQWTTHKMSWEHHQNAGDVHLNYRVFSEFGDKLLDIAGTDEQARHTTEGGIGFGYYSGNNYTWVNHVHIAEGERHDDQQ